MNWESSAKRGSRGGNGDVSVGRVDLAGSPDVQATIDTKRVADDWLTPGPDGGVSRRAEICSHAGDDHRSRAVDPHGRTDR